MAQEKWDRQETKIKIIVFVLLLALFGVIHLLVPGFFATMARLSTGGNMQDIVAFLQSFGLWAVFVSFFFDVLINALGFLPSIFLSTANGLVFGLPLGILISWTAESVGVIISFLIMRYFLRASAEQVIEKSNSLQRLDEMSGEKGLLAMTLARTMPYFPSGILTALGAVSKMSIRDYVLASFVGKFPSTALEVVLGHDIVNFRQHMNRLALLVVIVVLVYGYIYWRNKKKNEEK